MIETFEQIPMTVKGVQWIPEFNNKEIMDFANAQFVGEGCSTCDRSVGLTAPNIKGKHGDFWLDPGDWVVEIDGHFERFTDAEFRARFTK